MNFGRLLLGALVASVICFMTDGAMHELLLKQQWTDLYAGISATAPSAEHDHGGSMVWFAIFELGRGFLTLFIYVLARGKWGPGAKTAIVASVAAWFAFSLTGPVQMLPLGLFSTALWFRMAGFQLVTSIAAGLAGAALYKE